MNGRPTVLFYCQHSLGLGHLVRSFALAGALVARFRVILLNGGPLPAGFPVPAGVEVSSIAPLGMDTEGALVSRDGRRTVTRALSLREQQIRRVVEDVRPDVAFVELFPFGRKKFADEILGMIAAVRARNPSSVVVSSLRDILVGARRDQARHDERAAVTTNALFDAVLVHTDPRFATLDESFHPTTPLKVPVHYTGFVLPGTGRPPERRVPENPRVVVSAGGGLYGEPILRAAVGASAELAGDGVALDLVAGPFLPDDAWTSLRAAVRRNASVRAIRSVPDLCSELAAASVSVSQCGYNTALDVLRARVPAIVVPFAEGREDEQTRRADRLARLGAVRVLPQPELTPQTLAREIRAALATAPPPVGLDFGGAATTARILDRMVGAA